MLTLALKKPCSLLNSGKTCVANSISAWSLYIFLYKVIPDWLERNEFFSVVANEWLPLKSIHVSEKFYIYLS